MQQISSSDLWMFTGTLRSKLGKRLKSKGSGHRMIRTTRSMSGSSPTKQHHLGTQHSEHIPLSRNIDMSSHNTSLWNSNKKGRNLYIPEFRLGSCLPAKIESQIWIPARNYSRWSFVKFIVFLKINIVFSFVNVPNYFKLILKSVLVLTGYRGLCSKDWGLQCWCQALATKPCRNTPSFYTKARNYWQCGHLFEKYIICFA